MPRESAPRPTLRRRARHSSIRSIDPDPSEPGQAQAATPHEHAAPEATAPEATAHDAPPHVPRVTPAALDPWERRQLIARAAYFRAERRGFSPDRAIDDWLEAEREFDATRAETAP
jgi:hypothetical protein